MTARKTFGGDKWVLLLIPAIVFLSVLFLFPTVEIISRAFSNFLVPQVSGLDNFRWFFETPVNLTVLVRTAFTTGLVTATCVLIAYPYAYYMTIAGPRIRALLLGIVVVTSVTSFLVRSYAWVILLRTDGPVSDGLASLGFGHVTLTGTTAGVTIALVQILLPLMILPIYANLVRIDRKLLLAARSLGARRLVSFWKILLPLSIPGILAGSLLVGTLVVGFYITPTLVGSPENALISQVIVTQIEQLLAWGRAGAISVILLAMMVGALLAVGFAMRRSRSLTATQEGDGLGSEEQHSRISRQLLPVFAATVVVFLVAPLLVVIRLSFTDQTSLMFPPPGWSTRWYQNFFSDPQWTSALWLSVRVALLSTVLSTLLGTAAALGVARTSFRAKWIGVGFILAPLFVPVVIISIGVYAIFLNWHLIGSTQGFVLAHSILAIPYVFVAVLSGLAGFDTRLEQAAASLGAPMRTVFRRITLPLILPSVLTGAFFAFLTSIDESAISIFISTANSRTLPVEIYTGITRAVDPTVAAAATVVTASTALMLTLSYVTRRLNVR